MVRVVTRLNVGGPARHALLLSRGLAPSYDTTLVVGRPAPGEGELLDAAGPVHRVPLVRELRPATDVRAFGAVRRILGERRPAIVHTHMAKAGTVTRLAVRSARERPRTIHTFHGHVLEGYFGPTIQRAFVQVERTLARSTDVLVAVSDQIRDELLELRIGQPSQYHVVPVGLELAPYLDVAAPAGTLRRSLGLGADVPLVGVVGRLVPIKDHRTLLRAMRDVPDTDLVVIGDGELRAELEGEAEHLGIRHRTHFTGWRSDMADTLSDLDVVVLTSRNEGTPVALIEASAAGRAVVATDVGGVRSVVEHGRTGLLTERDDAAAVAAGITQLLADPTLRRRMGAAGREHVRVRFGDRRLLEDIGSLYAELLGRRR